MGVAAAAMPPARASLADQAGGLPRAFHEAVRQAHPMVTARHLVEVPDVETRVAVARPIPFPVRAQEALDLGQRDRPARGAPAPVVEQPVVAIPLIPPPQPPHRARTDAQDIRDLQPALPPAQCSQDRFLHLHGALHGSPGVGQRHLPGAMTPRLPAVERSDHVLPTHGPSAA